MCRALACKAAWPGTQPPCFSLSSPTSTFLLVSIAFGFLSGLETNRTTSSTSTSLVSLRLWAQQIPPGPGRTLGTESTGGLTAPPLLATAALLSFTPVPWPGRLYSCVHGANNDQAPEGLGISYCCNRVFGPWTFFLLHRALCCQ